MVDSKLDEGRIQFGAPEDAEQNEKPKGKQERNEEAAARAERFAEEHAAGYLAAHLSGSAFRDEPGFGAHGLERLSDDPRAFDLRGGPPSGSIDARLRDDIEAALRQEPGLDPSHVEVSVHHGDAFLTGTVPERHMDELAEQVSLRVTGVRRVHNGLRFKRGGTARAQQ